MDRNAYLREYSKTEKAVARRKKYTEKLKQEGKISQYNKKYRESGGSNISKEYYNNSKRKVWKNYQLKRDYGITLEQYDERLEQQNYSCLICGSHKDLFSKDLAVDHCHSTGKIRGLLCKNCNTGIGNFKDDVEIMKRAIEYIERNK